MIVLGADLSFTRSGLVWLDGSMEAGHLRTHYHAVSVPSGDRRMLRAMKLFSEALDKFYIPSLCIIEDAAYGVPSRTTMGKLKELSGVFKAVLESYGIDWLEISPTMAKKHITGKGTSEKHIVARELKRKYGIAFKDDVGHDLSDAAALAIWGLER